MDPRHQDAVLATAEVLERSFQFSVSRLKAPARVLTVEAVMDVASAILWPASDSQSAEMDDIDALSAASVSGGARSERTR